MLVVHEDWLLTPYRAAVHLPTGMAVIADLHLGYAQARGRRGEAVPRPRLEDELHPLRQLAEVCQVQRFVFAGDLTHAGMSDTLLEELTRWLETHQLVMEAVIPGNHDRFTPQHARTLPLSTDGIKLGAWRVIHGDGPLPGTPCVFGHFHPCLSWQGVKAPCYLVGEKQLVLPAYSHDAAGVNVRKEPRWAAYRCCAIAGEKMLDFGLVGRMQSRSGKRREKTYP